MKHLDLLERGKYKQSLDAYTKQVYLAAYRAYNCNQTATANALGVARGTFRAKLKLWGIL